MKYFLSWITPLGVLFLAVSAFGGLSQKDKLEIVKDFLKGSACHSPVKAFFCTPRDKFGFFKSFSQYSTTHLAGNYHEATSKNGIIFLINSSCNGFSKLLIEANNQKLFSLPNKWVILRENSPENFDVLMQDLNILVDSDFTIVNFHEEVTLNKIYKLQPKGEIKEEKIAEIKGEKIENWNGTFPTAITTQAVARRRGNLLGANLKICLVITHNDSLNHLTDKRDKHIDTIAKVNYVFMLLLKDLMNCSVNFTIENTWGYFSKSGGWSGMIGQLIRNEADLGGTPLFLTKDRIPIIDYVAMTTPTKSKFVFRQPKLSYVTNVFTLPFEDLVWLSCISMVLIMTLAMYIIISWEVNRRKRASYKNNRIKIQEGEFFHGGFSEVMFLAWTLLCQQGSNLVPSSSAGRIVLAVLAISLMFLYTSYSANIVALLQSSSNNINTLDDLLHSRLQVGVDDTVFNRVYFPNATEPVRKALYEQKVSPPGQPQNFFPIEEGVRRLQKGLFAFHMETGAGYKIVTEKFLEHEKCGLQEIQFLQVPDPWIAVQKNSSYKEILKIGFRKIHERGLQNREVSLLYTKKPPCITRSSGFVGVTIVDCYPAVTILWIGISLSFFIFIFELIFFHKSSLMDFFYRRPALPYVD